MHASDIAIAILTGRRPHLLEKTLKSLPEALWDAKTVAFHNSGDTETRNVLDQFPIGLRYTTLDELWTIGKATSELFRIAQLERRAFVLYLQDDWECQDQNGEWWTAAMDILDRDQQVGQVRLRLTGEQTYINHFGPTGKKVHWSQFDGYRLSPGASWSLNPFIMRAHELPATIESERHEMIRFAGQRRSIAQLTPGVFKHIGGKGESLRIRADKERRYSRV